MLSARYAALLWLAVSLFALACGDGGTAPVPSPEASPTPPAPTLDNALASYANGVFNVEFMYPAGWVPDPDYSTGAGGIPEAYRDPRGRAYGYFDVDALNATGFTIDEAASSEAGHKLKPYGDNPEIVPLTVDGRDARMILPDEATAPEPSAAELVVSYPSPVTIGGPEPYSFLIIYAHEDFLGLIAETLRLTE